MRRQQEAAHGPRGRIALVVDSACDLPAEVFDRQPPRRFPFSGFASPP
jgi:hypothetical protein